MLQATKQELAAIEQRYRERLQIRPLVSDIRSGKKSLVCLCEDVTETDLCDGVTEGFGEIELLKRYSTVTMGPCQGKMCAMTSIGICARETGKSIAETGTTTARPPIQPVSLGVLAGRNYQPVNIPPHHKHVALAQK